MLLLHLLPPTPRGHQKTAKISSAQAANHLQGASPHSWRKLKQDSPSSSALVSKGRKSRGWSSLWTTNHATLRH
ncbi:hypothetical protein F7725_004078, partial [Dissostichus mawsoni]